MYRILSVCDACLKRFQILQRMYELISAFATHKNFAVLKANLLTYLLYLLHAHHAYVAHRAKTKSFQRCLSLANFSMVLQL